eukprot:m.88725 g.88725  ORF g.88725 m.88725 type:complete len:137 (+) comp26229_c1_seq1:64-474(+)
MSKSKGPTQQQVEAQFQKLQNEQKGLYHKIGEMESELHEHGVVVDCLSKVDADRKCFRMIGGVLVERTVKEVLPAVDANKAQINQVLVMLKKKFDDGNKAIEAFKDQYGVQQQGQGGQGGQQSSQQGSSKGAGVLV